MRAASPLVAVDVHAAGEPGRVVIGGVLDVPGQSMFEKMTYFAEHHDDIRLRMLREPRGYPAMCLQRDPATHRLPGRRRLHHHGAERVPAHVGQ